MLVGFPPLLALSALAQRIWFTLKSAVASAKGSVLTLSCGRGGHDQDSCQRRCVYNTVFHRYIFSPDISCAPGWWALQPWLRIFREELTHGVLVKQPSCPLIPFLCCVSQLDLLNLRN